MSSLAKLKKKKEREKENEKKKKMIVGKEIDIDYYVLHNYNCTVNNQLHFLEFRALKNIYEYSLLVRDSELDRIVGKDLYKIFYIF